MKKHISIIALCLAILPCLVACKDKIDVNNTSRLVFTEGVEFGMINASLHGRLSSKVNLDDLPESPEFGFIYGYDAKLQAKDIRRVQWMDMEGDGDDVSTWRGFRANLLDLIPNTLYYYRAYLIQDGEQLGQIKSFRTDPVPVAGVGLDKSSINLFINQNETEQLTATVYPEGVEHKGLTWSSDDSSIASVDKTGLVTAHKNGVTYIRVSVNETSFSDKCLVTVKTIELPPEGAVDMGLPSGKLWRDRNVGASKSSDIGNYYAWGEVSTKSSFTLGTYKYDYYGNLSKYTGSGHKGYTGDGKFYLEDADDAASANRSDKRWRMPTDNEVGELIKYTTYTVTTVNGQKGIQLKAKNAVNGKYNTLFLPYGCYKDGSSQAKKWHCDDDGFDYDASLVYWTNLVHDRYESGKYNYIYARTLQFSRENYDFGTYYLFYMPRYYGVPVRPICNKINAGN